MTPVSHIRQTMVKLLVPPATLQQSSDTSDCGKGGIFGAMPTEGSNTLGGSSHPMDPSTCIFWCAVALGALVKGIPIESVSNDVLVVFATQRSSSLSKGVAAVFPVHLQFVN